MLVLCSNGLSSKQLRAALPRATDEKYAAALVINADPVYKERNYHVPRCLEELASLGYHADLFDLDHRPAEELLRYDAVEFIGGNPYELLHCLRLHHAKEVLRHLADEKLLIGWSAAAFVFGPTLQLVNRYSPEMNTVGLTDLAALSLTDIQVLPHYSRFLTRFDRFEETCRAYEDKHHVSVIRLNDGDGVIITADGAAVIYV